MLDPNPFPVKAPSAPSRPPLRLVDPWFYSLLACFLLTFLFSTHLINDSDLGLHLKGGQWILENLRFPSNDTYTYTVPEHPYLDIHWLYQVALYLLYRIGGYSLVSLFHVFLIGATVLLVFKRLRLVGAPLWACVLLIATTLLTCEIRFRVRPEIASWFLMSLTLWVLESRVRRNRDLLFSLPLIQLVWVNMEGLFILGWILMGVYWVSSRFDTGRIDKKLLLYSSLSIAFCLVNPYFLRGVAYPLANLTTLSDPVMHDSLKELQSPWFATPTLLSAPTLYLLLYKLFSFFLFGLMAVTFHKRKIRDWLLFAVFFGLSVSAFRNIPLFMITCLPLTAASWMDLEWGWPSKLQESLLSKPFVSWIITVFLLGLCLRVVTGAYYVSDRRTDRFGLGLDFGAQPVKACEFLVQNHLDGRILNQFDDGGWLDWKGPQKTFIDSRLEVFGGKFYSEYLRFNDSGSLEGLADKYQANILFFNPLNAHWTMLLQSVPDWRLVYLDATAAIFLRRGYADQVPDLDYNRLLSEAGVSRSILSESSTLLQASPPPLWDCIWEDLYKPVVFPNSLQNLGIFCANSGHPEASESLFLEAIHQTGGRYYDFYYNLGLLYAYTGRRPEAALCMQRVLREKPGDPTARQILGNGLP